ncbi:hypothetical protein AAHA92_32522 [Salvia divinorum]|uniref:DUF1677 family protein n=1 Tax=Salvia divinorum TaxID=28513 RepID=A0ABD1FNN7_SALDI
MLVRPQEEEEEENNILPIMGDHQILRKTVSDVTNEMSKIGKELETIAEMEETIILQAECECCGLKEDYTKEYISRVRTSFSGKWVCGLCTEAVKERLRRCPIAMEDAIINHKRFVQDFNTTTRVNPKLSLAWMMRDIAKRNYSKRNNLSGGIKIIRTSSCAGRIDYNSEQEH